MLEKFPLEEQLLDHAEVADLKLMKDKTFESVQFFIERYTIDVNRDKAETEFLHLQIDQDLPRSITEAERMDVAWHLISNLKCGGTDKYSNISKVMLCILVIPHSNADSERVFSMVRKNDTEFRPSLKPTTISNLMVQKVHTLSQDQCCNYQFSDEELRKCKKATREANQRKPEMVSECRNTIPNPVCTIMDMCTKSSQSKK